MVPKLREVGGSKSPLILAVWLGAMLALGCAKAPSARECRSSSDCSPGQSCAFGVCQEDLSLAIRSPSQPVVTNGDVNVEVAVTGVQPTAVELQIDGVTVATLAPPFAGVLTTTALSEGKHGLTAVAWEGTRQFSSQPVSVAVDRTTPAAPTVAASSPTRANPVIVGGTAEAGATIRVFEAGAQVGADAIAAAGGAWSAALDLAEGEHDLTATATDGAGNTSSASALASVVVDRTPPAAPSLIASSPTRAYPVAVQGTAEPGAAVRVFDAAVQVAPDVVASASGAWSASLQIAEGAHDLSATATDPAGNTSAASAAVAVLVDRTPPSAPFITVASPTRANPVPVGGTAEAGATIRLFDGGTPVGTEVVATAGGTWSASLALAEGKHDLTATAADGAGNVSSSSASAAVIVDRTAPAPPSIAAASPTRENPAIIGGTAEPGATVHLFEGSAPAAPDTAAAANGAWSASVALAEGAHQFTATATDQAGNTSSASAVATIAVDRTAPTVLSTTPANGAANIWSRDPIIVTFSEPILAASVTSQSVAVQANGSAVVLQSMALSADGKTLTLTPDPALLPPVPAQVVATLTAGIQDRAGNPLSATTWKWSLPDWLDAAPSYSGGYLGVPHAPALSPAGAVFDAAKSGPSGLIVAAYRGGTWESLGTVAPKAGLDYSTPASIAVDSKERPVVVDTESGAVHVRRRENDVWNELGQIGANSTARPLVRVDSLDRRTT